MSFDFLNLSQGSQLPQTDQVFELEGSPLARTTGFQAGGDPSFQEREREKGWEGAGPRKIRK